MIEIEWSDEKIVFTTPSIFLNIRNKECPTVIRTRIDELDLYILNILSPMNTIFWSFGIFSTMEKSRSNFEEKMRKLGQNYLHALLKKHSISKKSIVAYEFFAPFTKRMGDMYFPYNTLSDEQSDLLHKRHISTLVATSQYEEYINYFNDQISQFGNDAFRYSKENQSISITPKTSELIGYKEMCIHPSKMSHEEKKRIYNTIHQSNYIESIDNLLRLLLGSLGGYNIAVTESIYQDSLAKNIIFERVRTAIETSSLQVVERLPNRLNDLSWNRIVKDRDNLLRLINMKLKAFPIISKFI